MYTDKWKYGPQLIIEVMRPCGETPFHLSTLTAFIPAGLLLLRAHHGVGACEASGTGAPNGVSVGTNQMYQFGDSRDLFLPVPSPILLIS